MTFDWDMADVSAARMRLIASPSSSARVRKLFDVLPQARPTLALLRREGGPSQFAYWGEVRHIEKVLHRPRELFRGHRTVIDLRSPRPDIDFEPAQRLVTPALTGGIVDRS